ncbi:MAG: dihydroorotate dehydrogenase electron transfer subunit [Candidatus Marinimicrobia bacterium]|nr:dihydroorotate dehydrogenase electron transfer subunit [Candidatus Neomarinimicrobiota bacterium]
MYIEDAIVSENKAIAEGIYRLDLSAPRIAATAQPGQFVNILVHDDLIPLLRRPMSVAGVNGDNLALIYKIFGAGTTIMESWASGQRVNLLGPLGHGWEYDSERLPILVGGGVGLAPINFLHEYLLGISKEHWLVIGARSKKEHFLAHDPANGILLTTDDGSAGFHGTALDGLQSVLRENKNAPHQIFACGPPAMLQAIGTYAVKAALPCQLAVEEMMGCGFGICQGCSIEAKVDADNDQPSYGKRFKLVCMDGPVFHADQLVLNHD